MLSNILIYGGSFDPIHLGHLNTALAVQNEFQFERFIFLPCKTPVLKKTTTASCAQRVHMLKLALKPYPQFEINLCEIQRETPSFMVDTLQHFRNELGEHVSITLLLGMDAFLQLPQWHSWKKIIELSHLLVMKRAQMSEQIMPKPLKALLDTHEIMSKSDLIKQPYGKIYSYNAGEYAISSSQLREKINLGENIRPYLSDTVYQYISLHKIYTYYGF